MLFLVPWCMWRALLTPHFCILSFYRRLPPLLSSQWERTFIIWVSHFWRLLILPGHILLYMYGWCYIVYPHFLSIHILLIFQLVQSAFQSILANIGSRTLEEFKKAFANALKNGKDFTVAANEFQQACMKSFDGRCAGKLTNVMMPIVVSKQKNQNHSIYRS